MFNQRPNESGPIVAKIDPASYGAGVTNTPWIDMAKYGGLKAVLAVGVMQANSTIDLKVQQAKDSSGTGAKDVTGRVLGQMTKASSDDSKQARLDVRQDDLDFDGDFRFVRFVLTVGTAASLASLTVEAIDPRFNSLSTDEATSVDQSV